MAPRRTRTGKPAPTFDPNPSIDFGALHLDALHVEYALIGRVAMWYWLDNEADHEYTKDVDFAVPQSVIPALTKRLRDARAEVKLLQIGGIHGRIESEKIRTDFIDRSSEEWGNLQPLYLDAIRAANLSEDRSAGVAVASPEHLVAMKVGAGTEKDSRDAVRLLAKVEDIDVEKARSLCRKYLGATGIGVLEECLRRAGHPNARRAYTAGS